MKEIPLTQGKFTIVDDEDYKWLNQWKWYCHNGYAARKSSATLGPRKIIYMHREIAKTPKGSDTDHANGNRLDNRRANLRACDRSQNVINRGVNKKNKTGFKGVFFFKKKMRWVAAIKLHGKRRDLGYFDNPLDAAQAYEKEAKELHGEFYRPADFLSKNKCSEE